MDGADFDIVALTGTSRGAIGALLAWHGLITGNYAGVIAQLQTFWTAAWPAGNASAPAEILPNERLVWLNCLPVKTELSP